VALGKGEEGPVKEKKEGRPLMASRREKADPSLRRRGGDAVHTEGARGKSIEREAPQGVIWWRGGEGVT